jgi:hypothetical protein
MAGRPKKEGSESKSFAIYEETWLLLKELEHSYLKETDKNKPLKEIAHEAIKRYFTTRMSPDQSMAQKFTTTEDTRKT